MIEPKKISYLSLKEFLAFGRITWTSKVSELQNNTILIRISKLYIETVPQGGSGLRKKDNFWPHLPSSLTRRKPSGLEDEVDFV